MLTTLKVSTLSDHQRFPLHWEIVKSGICWAAEAGGHHYSVCAVTELLSDEHCYRVLIDQAFWANSYDLDSAKAIAEFYHSRQVSI